MLVFRHMQHEMEHIFFEAYETHADAIFRHCMLRVSDRELAKDLMQEAFTHTWEYMQNGNNPKNLRAFIYRVASNLVIDHYRKKKSYSLDEMSEKTGFDPSIDMTENIVNGIDAKRALELLPQLPDQYRSVIVMRYVDDLSPGEIATITDETENTVSVRIHRGVKKLRELIEKSST